MTTTPKKTETKASSLGRQLPYLGSTHAATKDGFIIAVAEANRMVDAGYEVVTLQRLDTTIAVLYRLVRTKPAPKPEPSLVGDDDYEGSDKEPLTY